MSHYDGWDDEAQDRARLKELEAREQLRRLKAEFPEEPDPRAVKDAEAVCTLLDLATDAYVAWLQGGLLRDPIMALGAFLRRESPGRFEKALRKARAEQDRADKRSGT